MDRLGLVLRSVVFFLFLVPFLLGFALEHNADWTGHVAYIAIGVLALAAAVTAWATSRRARQP